MTPELQDKDRFLVSNRSCPKTDGLRPHHWPSLEGQGIGDEFVCTHVFNYV